VTGYDVRFDAEPKPPEPETTRAKRRHSEAPLAMQRDADAERTIAQEREQSRQRAAAIVPDKLEMDRLRRKAEKTPKRLPLSGIGLFLFQPQVAVNAVIMALGFGILGLCVRGLIAFWPF
jgi:hypothetical protein